MGLTYNQLYLHVRHVLGSETAAELVQQQIVDSAVAFLVSAHPWRFLQRKEARLSTRGQIALTAATWAPSTLRLTETDAFADYSWLTEDEIEITGGTGVTLGTYQVASRIDDDTIELSTSISTGTPSDVAGTLTLPRIGLPSDFHSLIAVGPAGAISMVSPALLTQMRNDPPDTGASAWIAALTYIGSPMVPVLDLHPAPATNETGIFRLLYKRGAVRGTSASTLVDWPDWCDNLLIETVRAYALGWEPTKEQFLSDLLAKLVSGPVFLAAVHDDARTQSYYGLIRNGAAQRSPTRTRVNVTDVGGPA